ncbi:MAG: hypothetical protein K1000chlam4_00949, partial [Chlamydiae bacterium]|nr:hypothetical protein [Chlamydiota bacterium]
MRKRIFLLLLLPLIYAYTIAEKKESFHQTDHELDLETEAQLKSVNLMLAEKRHSLKACYGQVPELYASKCDETDFLELLKEINSLKGEISEIEEMWRDETSSLIQNDAYALWHQPDTTLLQLVMDYGIQDCVYLVPPEVGGIRLSVNSNLPIPRESWNECLELILSGHGVGVRQLNPYLRELFFLRTQPSLGLKHITSDPHDLDILPNLARVCFVLSPDTPDPRGVLQFLQKFSNPMTTTLHVIGGDIFIVSSTEMIKELLKLYDFVRTGNHHQDYQLVTSSKIDAQQMETILNSAFLNTKTGEEMLSLKIVPLQTLSHALFLFGTKDEVSKATKLIRDIEAQIENPLEKTIFWYTVKHSDAEDLANTLAKVYDQLVGGASFTGEKVVAKEKETNEKIITIREEVKKEPLGVQ